MFSWICKKNEKVWPNLVYQNSLKKWVSIAILSFVLLLWCGELMARWTLLNSDLKETNWPMESTKEKLDACKVSRIDIVKTHLNSGYNEGCSDQWLKCAEEVLFLNGIETLQFVTSIKDLLIHGRVEVRVTKPTNWPKTFLLKPLRLIFSDSIFENPASDKYAWIESEKAKVFFGQ